MKNERLFFSDEDELSGRSIVIEEDVYSVWAYLTFPNELDIDKSCFLSNTKRVKDLKSAYAICKQKKLPPPITTEYGLDFMKMDGIESSDLGVQWKKNGNVVLKIKGKPFLFFCLEAEKGFCKNISKNGIFGNAWDEDKFNEIFY